ncbi:MAG: CPBP family intramembrane metalloprotease [Prevotellaceae bacterium]|nr:CPBP family intramembrane metalloprotease [Prevotellaceae bacterium]
MKEHTAPFHSGLTVFQQVKSDIVALALAVYRFVKLDFHLLSYVYTLIVVVGGMYANYRWDIYNTLLRPTYATGQSPWVFGVFWLVAYFSVAIPVLLLQKQYSILRNPRFYIKIVAILVVYGVAIGYLEHYEWELPTLMPSTRAFLLRCFSQLKVACFMLIPIIIMKKTIDRQVHGLYGLSLNAQYIKGYLLLLAVMLPALIATSFTPDFLQAYPQFRPWRYQEPFGMPVWLYTTLFETSYAVDFVMVELLFRGVLVLGMVSLLGHRAILPMVALYVSIHYGKPPLETLSSMFGGYILGALAYQTKHIWGGVFVHIGIALTMEIMGFLHYYLSW